MDNIILASLSNDIITSSATCDTVQNDINIFSFTRPLQIKWYKDLDNSQNDSNDLIIDFDHNINSSFDMIYTDTYKDNVIITDSNMIDNTGFIDNINETATEIASNYNEYSNLYSKLKIYKPENENMLSLEQLHHMQNLNNDEKQVYMSCIDYCQKNGVFADLLFPNMKKEVKEQRILSRDQFDYSIFDEMTEDTSVTCDDSKNDDSVVYVDDLTELDPDMKEFVKQAVQAYNDSSAQTIIIDIDNDKLWDDLTWDYMETRY